MSHTKESAAAQCEADPRFPSGPWTGYYLQRHFDAARHWMQLRLAFADGRIAGEGRDDVGKFTIAGRYDIADGRCRWTKHYLRRHDVFYSGYNEGRGIWGTWRIDAAEFGWQLNDGFYIWPEGMPDPTQARLAEEADVPAAVDAALALEAGAF